MWWFTVSRYQLH